MRSIKKVLLLSLAMTFAGHYADGQVLISKDGTDTADKHSILDVKSNDKGILIPRVSLISLTNTLPLSNLPTDLPESLMVYNISEDISLGLSKGYYYWRGAVEGWHKLATTKEVVEAISSGGGGVSINLIGEVTGPLDNTKVAKLGGKSINITTLTGGEVLKYDTVSDGWIAAIPTGGSGSTGLAIMDAKVDVTGTKIDFLDTDGSTVFTSQDLSSLKINGDITGSLADAKLTKLSGGNLPDISVTSIPNNAVLKYVDGVWVPVVLSSSGGSPAEITTLTTILNPDGKTVITNVNGTVANLDLSSLKVLGDVTGSVGSNKVVKIHGIDVEIPSTSDKYLKYDGTSFVWSDVLGGGSGVPSTPGEVKEITTYLDSVTGYIKTKIVILGEDGVSLISTDQLGGLDSKLFNIFGDVTGSLGNSKVESLHNVSLPTPVGSSGFLKSDGTTLSWVPISDSGVSGLSTIKGDVIGDLDSSKVVAINGVKVTGVPTSDQVLAYNGLTNSWEPKDLSSITIDTSISQVLDVDNLLTTIVNGTSSIVDLSSLKVLGDVTGDLSNSTVTKIQGKNVSVPTITDDKSVLTYDDVTGGLVWTSLSFERGVTNVTNILKNNKLKITVNGLDNDTDSDLSNLILSGDIKGTIIDNKVEGLQGKPIDYPSTNDLLNAKKVLSFDNTGTRLTWTSLPSYKGVTNVETLFDTDTNILTTIVNNTSSIVDLSPLKGSSTTEWKKAVLEGEDLYSSSNTAESISREGSVVIGKEKIKSNPYLKLDVSSKDRNQGIKAPEVTLTSFDMDLLEGKAGTLQPEGMVVYNDGKDINMKKGHYYWDGTKWNKFSTDLATTEDAQIGNIVCNPSDIAIKPRLIPSTYRAGEQYYGTLTVPYTGGNGARYIGGGEAFTVDGLTFVLQSGKLSEGDSTAMNSLVFSVSGIPVYSSPNPVQFTLVPIDATITDAKKEFKFKMLKTGTVTCSISVGNDMPASSSLNEQKSVVSGPYIYYQSSKNESYVNNQVKGQNNMDFGFWGRMITTPDGKLSFRVGKIMDSSVGGSKSVFYTVIQIRNNEKVGIGEDVYDYTYNSIRGIYDNANAANNPFIGNIKLKKNNKWQGTGQFGVDRPYFIQDALFSNYWRHRGSVDFYLSKRTADGSKSTYKVSVYAQGPNSDGDRTTKDDLDNTNYPEGIVDDSQIVIQVQQFKTDNGTGDTSGSSKPSIEDSVLISGDVTGTLSKTTVKAIHNKSIPDVSKGYLKFDGVAFTWEDAKSSSISSVVNTLDKVTGTFTTKVNDKSSNVVTLKDVNVGGDITGNIGNAKVEKLHNAQISAPKGTDINKYLQFDGTKFVWATPGESSTTSSIEGLDAINTSLNPVDNTITTSVTSGGLTVTSTPMDAYKVGVKGDVTGNLGTAKVSGLLGNPIDVSTTPLTNNQVLKYDETNKKWIPGDAGSSPWKNQSDNKPATDNSSNIYQKANVAVGKDTGIIGKVSLDVSGSLRAGAPNPDSTNLGQNSVAIGTATAAYHDAAAFGVRSYAQGVASLAVGLGSVAEECMSVAMGENTRALGAGSVALNGNTTSPSIYETVIGQYNKIRTGRPTEWDTKDAVFQVGIGTGDKFRENALTVQKDGLNTIHTAKVENHLDILAGSSQPIRIWRGGSKEVTNLAIGSYASPSVGTLTQNTGTNNLAIGAVGTMMNNTTGSNNIAIGNLADTGATSTGSIAIGVNSKVEGKTNSIAIGNGVTVNTDNTIRLGDDNITKIGGKVSFSTFSDRRYKKQISDISLGLDFINKLRPVEYYKLNDKTKEWGFIAQELEETLSSSAYKNAGLVSEDGSKEKMLSVRYTDLIAPMTKAIQELSEQNKKQQQEIDELKALVKQLLNKK